MYIIILVNVCIQSNFAICILFLPPIGLIIFLFNYTTNYVHAAARQYTPAVTIYFRFSRNRKKKKQFCFVDNPFSYIKVRFKKKKINLSSLRIPRNLFFSIASKMASCRTKNQFCVSQKGISYVLPQQQLNERIKYSRYNIMCVV